MAGMKIPLSVLDLAIVNRGQPPHEALAGSVPLAQKAEALGYERVWYAEHHNMAIIASSAPAVLIAHVAAHTQKIRLGAGGVMLPNHSPLSIAEQYGTLACLHPGRIDLGLGRAPGGSLDTLRALRKDPQAGEAFPQDVLELQGYLCGKSLVKGIAASPTAHEPVPLYILGSSLFGAQLAAKLGLPFGFASHFAPQALRQAVGLYRRTFQPSAQLARPHVIAGVNVLGAHTLDEARDQLRIVHRARIEALAQRTFSDAEFAAVQASPFGQQAADMMLYTALGPPAEVGEYLRRFAGHAEADELIVATLSPSLEQRLVTLEIAAEAMA
jgi:luciferase family oxidoreductase group 1